MEGKHEALHFKTSVICGSHDFREYDGSVSDYTFDSVRPGSDEIR